jgi:hypothetical protein
MPRPGAAQTVIASQTPMATITATITHQTTGVTRFELPLRGESFAAWLNSWSISAIAVYRNTALTLCHSDSWS